MNARFPFSLALAAIALLLVGGAVGWAIQSSRSAKDSGAIDDAEFNKRVHAYIVDHPEVLVEAAENLKSQGGKDQLADVIDAIEKPFPGAVLGNPNGTLTLVEFTDFACTYCRSSMADVEAVIAANPDLKVVIRELPIIAPTSGDAARWGLAAAEQGKYPAFHKAMFAAGRTDLASIESAARAAGLDLDRARKFIQDPRVSAELEANIGFARKLGIDGTPAWVIGEELIVGAIGREGLAKAVAAARGK
ncbi:MAG: DsbA family protein [Novosphingobium sp.]|nr:DsbA family protein [Novosphingobium sp.]